MPEEIVPIPILKYQFPATGRISMRPTQFQSEVLGTDGTIVGEWECKPNTTNIVYLPPFIVGPDDIGFTGGGVEFNIAGLYKSGVNGDPNDAYNFLLYISDLNDDPNAPQTGRATAAIAMFTHAVTGLLHRSTAGTDNGSFWWTLRYMNTQQYYPTFTSTPTAGTYRGVVHSTLKIKSLAADAMQTFEHIAPVAQNFDVAKRLTPAIQRVAGGSATALLNAQAGFYEPRPSNINGVNYNRRY